MVLRRVIVSQELPAGFFACFYPATEHFANFLEHLLEGEISTDGERLCVFSKSQKYFEKIYFDTHRLQCVELFGCDRHEKQKFENIQDCLF